MVGNAMSDKAERIGKRIADIAWMTGAKAQYDAIVPDQIAAIIREEYPEGETHQELDERLATKQALGAGCHDEYGLIVDCYSCGHYTEAVSGCDPIMPKCEGHKYWVRRARPAPDASALREAGNYIRRTLQADVVFYAKRGNTDRRDRAKTAIDKLDALLRSEPKLGGTV